MGIAEVSPASGSADMAPALRIIEEMAPVTEGQIIPLLQRLQDAYGYLPKEVVLEVCELTGLPASRVFGVATFYSQFYLEPRGRHLVRCCRGTACHVKGARQVIEAVRLALGVGEGGTSEDGRFTFETMSCLGECFAGPAMMVDEDCCGNMTADRVKKVLDNYK